MNTSSLDRRTGFCKFAPRWYQQPIAKSMIAESEDQCLKFCKGWGMNGCCSFYQSKSWCRYPKVCGCFFHPNGTQTHRTSIRDNYNYTSVMITTHPTDCIGAFDECNVECSPRKYKVIQRALHGGNACPFEVGEIRPCNPGDGRCPATTTDRLLSLVSGISLPFVDISSALLVFVALF